MEMVRGSEIELLTTSGELPEGTARVKVMPHTPHDTCSPYFFSLKN
jgi:hypothetical protein